MIDESAPGWVRDLVVQRGGGSADEVLLLRAADRNRVEPLMHVAFAGTSVGADDRRAWVAVAFTEAAFHRVLEYFDSAPGDDGTHDKLMRRIRSMLPLDSCWLTVVSVADATQDSLIELRTDPPNYRGEVIGECSRGFNEHGFLAVEPELDESWMYKDVTYATGDHGLEWVLGWDDRYSDEQWRFRQESERLFVSIRPDPASFDRELLHKLVSVIPETRRKIWDYINGPQEDDVEPYEEMPTLAAEPDQRCPASGQNVGRVIEIPGMDDWKIQCPTCGAMWAGGKHNSYGARFLRSTIVSADGLTPLLGGLAAKCLASSLGSDP